LQDQKTNEVRAVGTADQAGLPLVVSEEWGYPSWQVELPPASRLILYTDGLEEAFPGDDERHQQFGVQGITATLREMVHEPLETVLQELFDASHRATKGAGRLDDTSVMLLERSA
jgi:serine phosphatase RsbU (regulator of sigma subunit)